MELLKKNDRGYAVASLQRKLQLLGHDLSDDGILGTLTEGHIKAFQQDAGLQVDGVVGDETWEALLEQAYTFPLIAVEWDAPLPQNRYLHQLYDKRSIYLHHTAGRFKPQGAWRWWEQSPQRVATAYIIGRRDDVGNGEGFDGKTLQAFNPKHWAYHLGIRGERNDFLNASSIGIELCNLGPLERDGGQFVRTWRDRQGEAFFRLAIPESEVCVLERPWRGHRYFHKYTPSQLAECERLILSLAKQFQIPIPNVPYAPDWFDIDSDALAGKPGLWTHANVRVDKNDCYPDPDLIEMLHGLHHKLDTFEPETRRSIDLQGLPEWEDDDLRLYYEPLEPEGAG